MSKGNGWPQQTIRAEGSGHQPPKHDHCLVEKIDQIFPVAADPFRVLGRKFAWHRIFSWCFHLANGEEMMLTSAPNPEIGAPKGGKLGGSVQKFGGQFSPCVACGLSPGSISSVSNFERGHDPLPEIWALKHWLIRRCLDSENFRPKTLNHGDVRL